jgi:hypothetical protein
LRRRHTRHCWQRRSVRRQLQKFATEKLHVASRKALERRLPASRPRFEGFAIAMCVPGNEVWVLACRGYGCYRMSSGLTSDTALGQPMTQIVKCLLKNFLLEFCPQGILEC